MSRCVSRWSVAFVVAVVSFAEAVEAQMRIASLASPAFQRSEWQRHWARYDVRAAEVNEPGDGRLRTFYVSGELTPTLPGDETSLVRVFLAEVAPLLGVADPERDLLERKRTTDEHQREHVVFEHAFLGIPIRNAEMAVHIEGGTVYAFAGSVPVEPPGWRDAVQARVERANVTQEQARATASADAIANGSANARVERVLTRKRLIIEEPLVIWEVDVVLAGGGGRWLYDIDAVTGQIVAVRSLLQPDGQATERSAPRSLDLPENVQPTHAVLERPARSGEDDDPDDKPAGARPTTIVPNATTTVFSDGFEGAFPAGSWSAFDANGSTSGEVYWDDTSHRAYQGSWSLGCADGGANRVAGGGTYPANMLSWAIWGPFSLTGATGGSLTFRYWLQSELDFDYFRWMVSIDGTNFYGLHTSGSSGGWVTGTLDFTNVYTLGNITGQPNVWIGLQFTSDGTIGYEGAYVDDIVIRKVTPDATADLALQSIDATNGSYQPGEVVNVRNSTTNVGGQTSSGYRMTFYASTNTSITTSDTNLGFVDRSGLAAGANHTFDTSVPVPASLAPGSYYIGAILTVTDANSGNNTNYDPTPIDVTTETVGPKIGMGYGVLGNLQNHIDTYFDTAFLNEYHMRDVTRRTSTNPHSHNGRMGSSSLIETSVATVGIVTVADDVNNVWDAASDASPVDQHVYTGKVYDYLNQQLSLNGINGSGASMYSIVDIDSLESASCRSINAFWDGTSVGICAATGGFQPFSGALDVVAHEWGHAVTELAPAGRVGPLQYQRESGALNEAFSDWLGTAMEHWNGETNWTIGEGIRTLRDLSNPPLYSDPAIYGGTHWFPVNGCTPVCDGADPNYNDCCGVHTNSGVGNKMFYLLAQGGTFNGVTVAGLGVNTAMEIALDANRNHWPANATYAIARAGMIDSAAAFGAAAVNSVGNAWAAVGVGAPACTSFSISPSSASPGAAAGSQNVTITGTPSNCTGAWTATGNGSWLTVSPANGSGNGSATVSWTQNSGGSRSGAATIAGRTFSVTQAGQTPSGSAVRGDFNGDRRADIGVFRPSTGMWYSTAFQPTLWGQNGDIPVPGDYNRDGRQEVAVFRPSTGVWYGRVFYPTTWGQSGDIPAAADYDGDGDDDIAVFRPSTGMWYSSVFQPRQWGQNGDIPVPADYDGDGDDDIAVYRPSTGMWYSNAFYPTLRGQSGDIPVPADYDGDGDDDIATFRPSTGTWSSAVFGATVWGENGDVPVPADYDGDGDADVAVFRPSTGMWYSSGFYPTKWGAVGDVPLTAVVGSLR